MTPPTPYLDKWYRNHASLTKTQVLERLIADLWYQYPTWPSTFSGCAGGCGNPARGGALCPQCVMNALAELVGERLAAKYAASVDECATARNILYAAVSEG